MPRDIICNKKKRHFLSLANDIINKKISLEYFLKVFSYFEKIKNLILTKEQMIYLNIQNLKCEQHLTEIIDLEKICN